MRRVACLLLAAVTSACAALERGAPPEDLGLAPAPLVSPRPGDKLTWDRGYSETVVTVRGEELDWRYDNGNTFSSYRNFLLPPTRWDNRESKARSDIRAAPSLLWPLEVGKKAKFRVVQRVTRKVSNTEQAYVDEWDCAVMGTERVTVPVGTFDTYRLRCRMFWSGSIVEQAEWNYAPSLGQVVRRWYSGMERPEELVAFSPGGLAAEVSSLADKVMERALESAPSGRTVRDGDGLTLVAVTPTATFRTGKGGWCRQFLRTVQSGGLQSLQSALACRTAEGRWAVPEAPPPPK